MTEIPIIILVFITSISTILLVLGYVYRTSFPMSFFWFMVGIIFLLTFITTDKIILEYFLDGGTEDIIHYDQQSFTGVSDIFQIGGNDIRGEYVFSTSSLLFGDTIDCIDLTLRKSGSPTGTAIIGVYDHAQAVNNPIIQEFGDIDVSTLNTGFSSWYSFCLPLGTTYTIGDQDVLGIRYDAGDSSNFIRTNVATADAFDSTNTRYTSKSDNSNAWTDTTTSDLTALFYLRGEESTFETADYDIKVQDIDGNYTLEPTFIGIMLIVLSLSFIIIGVLIERT